MQNTLQQYAVSTLSKIASLVLIGALSACGGGGSDSNNSHSSDQDIGIDKPVTPPASTLEFTRIGYDYQLQAGGVGGDIGATIDANGNITLAHEDTARSGLNYSFAFPSGLNGGTASGYLFSSINEAANKDITILAPGNTKYTQNIFWRNADNWSIGGVGQAGYRTDLSKVTWPATGTVVYKGSALHYLIDSNLSGAINGSYGLYATDDVTAMVDYSAKTITIAVAPSPSLYKGSGNIGLFLKDPSKLGANLTVTDLDFSGTSLGYRNAISYSGLGLISVVGTYLNFFGSNAEELGGVLQYNGTLPGSSQFTTQLFSFALRKQ